MERLQNTDTHTQTHTHSDDGGSWKQDNTLYRPADGGGEGGGGGGGGGGQTGGVVNCNSVAEEQEEEVMGGRREDARQRTRQTDQLMLRVPMEQDETSRTNTWDGSVACSDPTKRRPNP